MERYFFVIDDGSLTVDEEGRELAGADAIAAAAMSTLLGIARFEVVTNNERDLPVTVRNEAGDPIYRAFGHREGRMAGKRERPLTLTPRVWTRSAPEGDDGSECDGRDVVSGQLVVAGGDATEVLEAIEGCFNPPAFAVAAFVVADLPLAAALAGDDWRDAFSP